MFIECRCETINLMFFQKTIKYLSFVTLQCDRMQPQIIQLHYCLSQICFEGKKGKIHCSPWNYGDVGFGTLHHFHQSISVSNIGSRPYMNCFSLLCLTPTHRTTICVWVSQCMRVWERVLFILRCERGGGGSVHIRSCICFNEYGIDVFPKLSL